MMSKEKNAVDQYEVNMKTKFAYGIVPGISDSGQEAESRDKVGSVDKNGVAVNVLAESGAESAARIISERFDELYSSEDGIIEKAILEKSETDSLLFVAVKENRYLAGQAGGGLIVRTDGSCSVLSKPVTEGQGRKKLSIYRGELQEPFGFMLVNGGALPSLYEESAGNLSPACGTFFEWLKEYDEETVSEALADNISKYFLKNTGGDIGVAIMVSDEEVLKGDEPSKNTGKTGQVLKYIISLAVVIITIFVFALERPEVADQKEHEIPEANPPVTYSENYEPTVTFSVDNPESYDAGEYQVGEDIPAGEYFFWTGEMMKPGDIEVDGDTCLSDELYCMTVQVKEGSTLNTEVRFTAAENVEPVSAADGILISGKYKIGKDIAPGTYTVSPLDENEQGRYYSIFDEEISNDTEVKGETTVEVPDEGYIVFYNSALVIDNK